MSSLTAKSRTIEHVELTVLSRLGSVGRLNVNSSTEDPIYCAIDSPQGKDGLNGIWCALAFIVEKVFALSVLVDLDCDLIALLFFIRDWDLFLFFSDDSDFDKFVVAFEVVAFWKVN